MIFYIIIIICYSSNWPRIRVFVQFCCCCCFQFGSVLTPQRFKWRRSEIQRSTLVLYLSEQSQNTFRRPTTSRPGAQLKTFLRSWLSVQENFWRFGLFSSSPRIDQLLRTSGQQCFGLRHILVTFLLWFHVQYQILSIEVLIYLLQASQQLCITAQLHYGRLSLLWRLVLLTVWCKVILLTRESPSKWT